MVFGARGGSAMEDPAAAGAARRRFIGRLAKNMESGTRNSRYYTDRDGHMSSHGASRVSVCSDFGYFEELYSYYTSEKAWHLCDPNAEQVFMALKKAGVKVAVVSNFDTRLRLLLRALKCDHWRISEAMAWDRDMLSCIRWQSIVIDEYHQLSQKSIDLQLIKILTTDSRIILLSGQIKLRGLRSVEAEILAKLKERLSRFIAYGSTSEVSKFIEYWVPIKISNHQLDQYCATLISNSNLLCSCSRNDQFGALRDILLTVRKRFKILSESMPKDAAFQIVNNELMMDGNPRLNLASFVTTWMEPECDRMIMAALNKNYVDMDEYPVTTELQYFVGRSELITEIIPTTERKTVNTPHLWRVTIMDDKLPPSPKKSRSSLETTED
ncbi:hypothetical protein CASFOL_039618 [Castilleja foliolosa]|uniref:Uncharacterized protein n=1 Tax=Castilleja foliolosa TaxID=1961234 RepID=A0ABD3BFQ6_9LAMI